MSTPATTAQVSGRVPGQDDTIRLHGHWLAVARAGWLVTTAVILGLSALAVPNAYALTQSVCRPGAHCLAAIELAQDDLRQLRQLGLTPGFLAAYGAGLEIATLLLCTSLAALIFWRRSQEPMALFCAYMLVLYGGATYTQLLDVGLRPLGPFWYWPVGVVELLAQVSFFTFFLVFPNGRFVPRWSRWVVLLAALAEVQYVFLTDQLSLQQTSSALPPLPFVTYAALVLTIVGLQVYRYRRVSTLREREQTKWVVFGFALAVGGFVVGIVLEHTLLPAEVVQSPVFLDLVPSTIFDGFFALIPISITVAILRGRLFDIDVIIRRTLIYGALTALLAAIYFGCVVGVQTILQTLTGRRGPTPAWLIVATTLLIAALFSPLRRRIQTAIDRRFYRAKYDAAKTLARFGDALRNETDLDQLRVHVLGVVEETMQPAHASLWLSRVASLRQDTFGQAPLPKQRREGGRS